MFILTHNSGLLHICFIKFTVYFTSVRQLTAAVIIGAFQIFVSIFVSCKKKKKNLSNNERRYLRNIPTDHAVWIAQMFSKRFLGEKIMLMLHIVTDDNSTKQEALTSMCWNMYGWLQIFFSCIIVFIKVFAPPLPWRKWQRKFENMQKICTYVCMYNTV